MEPSEQDGVNTSNPQQYKSNWNTEGTELSFVLKIHINHQQHQVLYTGRTTSIIVTAQEGKKRSQRAKVFLE